MALNTPPLQAGLTVTDRLALWPKAWANWITQVWQAIFYLWLSPVRTVSAAYTVQLSDAVILMDGNITVTLPLINEAGPKRITVKVINSGGGTRTVSGNGANIDGAATVTTTTQYTAWDFVNDGSNWWVI